MSRPPASLRCTSRRGSEAWIDRDVVISGPAGQYPDITAEDYLYQRVNANFAKEK
ncbi:1-aminocyclopropane-1-carboxylate oxidase [Rhodococcus opacus]|uniref:1-aminocyclopropane-1-carboxylate oxidase n=1 Tax=Rhodococcus opacus TaxID=37919 RepID=UPI0002DA0424|nr:1-aminocyclopropane-1-carboxylate oxidase [Rhodococcus opacus]